MPQHFASPGGRDRWARGAWIHDRSRPQRGAGQGVTFIHHSVVETPSGELIDPNFLPRQAPLFLEDPVRSYDYDFHLGWNTIAVADRPFRCPVTGARMAAWKPLWISFISGMTAYSMDPRHARRRHFPGVEDAGRHVASLGLDPASAVDLVFTTNLEVVRVEIPEGQEPSAYLKDYQLADLTIPDNVEPMDRSVVRSEQEEGRRLSPVAPQ
jgi:hypothetical protein